MTVEIVLDRLLEAPPAAVWPFITDPPLISQWSAALVTAVDPGDGGGYGAVGALRQVRLPGAIPVVVDEVVERAEPGERLVYRVYGRRTVRQHRGDQRLTPVGDQQTLLSWNVVIALAFPAVERPLRRSLVPPLHASLDKLAAVVVGAPPQALPAPREIDVGVDLDKLYATAEETAAAQRQMADAMRDAGDTRHWFSRVYEYVTKAMIAACRDGIASHPAWVLRLIPRFHELYDAAVASPNPPAHWRDAFAAIAAAEGDAGSALGFWKALIAGARAHIEGDLPHVLADTYRAHYRDVCDYVRFRADFHLLAAPLGHAWARLSGEVPPSYFPPYVRVLQQVVPPEITETIVAKRFYDPLPARRTAFERGRALAA